MDEYTGNKIDELRKGGIVSVNMTTTTFSIDSSIKMCTEKATITQK